MTSTIGLMPKPEKKRLPRRAATFRLPEVLLDLMEQLADSFRRSQTAELEIAIEEHLAKHDLWPVKQKEGEAHERNQPQGRRPRT